MSGHFSERFNPRGDEEVGESEEPRAHDPDDDRFLTPPLSLIGGEAGQTPDAMEERADGLELEPPAADRKRDNRS
jgi:hypothetical protein